MNEPNRHDLDLWRRAYEHIERAASNLLGTEHEPTGKKLLALWITLRGMREKPEPVEEGALRSLAEELDRKAGIAWKINDLAAGLPPTHVQTDLAVASDAVGLLARKYAERAHDLAVKRDESGV